MTIAPRECHRFRTLTLLPNTAARSGDPLRDPSSRLSYATAMRQIHTGEIPGLYTFSVEEGLRQEEAERAVAEARRMDEMAERAEGRRHASEQVCAYGTHTDFHVALTSLSTWHSHHFPRGTHITFHLAPTSISTWQAEDAGEEDEEKLSRTRAMDDWKDTHKRGYGNRKNRS